MTRFVVYYEYHSQWYDQCDDNYVPQSHKGQFEVEAQNMEEAEEKAKVEIDRKNEENLWGEDEEARNRNRQFPTHRIVKMIPLGPKAN